MESFENFTGDFNSIVNCVSVINEDNMDNIITMLLRGSVIIAIKSNKLYTAFCPADTFATRAVSEPASDVTVKGPKAGFTENSDMICIMGKNLENGNQYRFIYDPEHDMFVPYFGTEIKNGYIYTIPMYEGAEVPYGFVESYFVIQTVPMFTYMREDAELTQEEIAVGSLSEDNYLVFLMMDENGKEVHYTYDLVDRTFQRALLQKKDAEKVTELNETIDKLSEEIGKLNATHAERMNGRLTVIGVLIAAVVIMAGIIVNLMLKVSKLKKDVVPVEEADEDEDDEEDDFEVTGKGGLLGFFKKKPEEFEEEIEDEDEVDEDEEEEIEEKPRRGWLKKSGPKNIEEPIENSVEDIDDDDDLEILDLDLDDL